MKKITRDILEILFYIWLMLVIAICCLMIITGLTGCVVVQPCNCKEERHEEIKGWYWGENEGVIRTKEKIIEVPIQDLRLILEHIENESGFLLKHWLGEKYCNYRRLRTYVDGELD